jgi:hypothetical protein
VTHAAPASPPRTGWWAAAVAAVPVVLFWWMAPFVGGWSLGNDYVDFMLPYQQELQLPWALGQWPLWVPGYAGGQTAAALSFGQFFHPLAQAAAHLPGYWDGAAWHWNTLLRLATLALVHWALFAWFRRLTGDGWAFVLALAAVYNLRTLDCLRYGSALEAMTGGLWCCAALGQLAITPGAARWRWSLAAGVAWTITSGYPQMAYYALLGVLLFTALAPAFTAACRPAWRLDREGLRCFRRAAAWAAAAGIGITAAYWVPYLLDFAAANAGRAGRSYAFAAGYTDTFIGTADNFLRPLRSDVHGAFGGSFLLTVGALLPLLRWRGERLPRVIWLLWGGALLVFLHLQGARTPVHWLAWAGLPGGGFMRIPGRLALLLPLPLVLGVVWVTTRANAPDLPAPRAPVAWLAAITLAVVAGAGLLLGVVAPMTTSFAPLAEGTGSQPLLNRSVPGWVEPLAALAGLAALGCIVLGARLGRARLPALACCTVAQLALLLPYGTWLDRPQPSPTLSELRALRRETFAPPFREGLGYEHRAVQRQLDEAFLEPHLARLHVRTIGATSRPQVFERLRTERTPDDAVVVGAAEAEPPAGWDGRATVELQYSSYNRLEFTTTCDAPAWLVLAFADTGHGRWWVDGVPAAGAAVNGLQQGVRLAPGRHRVEWRCWSGPAALGVALSCLTLGLCLLAALWGRGGAGQRAGIAALAVVVAGGGFAAWRAWIYAGEDLQRRYRWERRVPDRLNLAYGKRVTVAAAAAEDEPYRTHPGLAVNGEREPRRAPDGAIAGAAASHGWLAVDLARPHKLGGLAVWEPARSDRYHPQQLEVEISSDGTTWQVAGVLPGWAAGAIGPRRIDWTVPRTARHLRLRARGEPFLLIDEIEIYPPRGGG